MIKPTNYSEFRLSLRNDRPAIDWPGTLQALWWDAKGEWNKAHDLVDGSNLDGADEIHAYLHRKEGDAWNAGYWYKQAGKPFPNAALDEEARKLIDKFVKS